MTQCLLWPGASSDLPRCLSSAWPGASSLLPRCLSSAWPGASSDLPRCLSSAWPGASSDFPRCLSSAWPGASSDLPRCLSSPLPLPLGLSWLLPCDFGQSFVRSCAHSTTSPPPYTTTEYVTPRWAVNVFERAVELPTPLRLVFSGLYLKPGTSVPPAAPCLQ